MLSYVGFYSYIGLSLQRLLEPSIKVHVLVQHPNVKHYEN
jgi:hypothetical protein